jgi:hypothetical protein
VRVLSFPVGLFLLLFAAISVAGQSFDRHLTSDSAHSLYKKSAYAHGYIHGYEDGFHDADLDIHMGRGERPLSVLKDYRDCNGGYQSNFGDKQYFRLGYKQGFREGYSDAIRGGQFRAINQTAKAAEGISDVSSPELREKDFDRAFSAGYDNGRQNGTNSSVEEPDFEHATNACQSRLPRSEAGQASQYCDAFIRGFSLGFDDGQASRVKRRTQTAKK